MLISLLEGIISVVGNKIINTTKGIPKITGTLKEVNKFWFILVLRLFCVFVFLLVLMMEYYEK